MNDICIYKPKASLEACFLRRNSNILTSRLNKVRTKLKSTWLIIFPENTELKMQII